MFRQNCRCADGIEIGAARPAAGFEVEFAADSCAVNSSNRRRIRQRSFITQLQVPFCGVPPDRLQAFELYAPPLTLQKIRHRGDADIIHTRHAQNRIHCRIRIRRGV